MIDFENADFLKLRPVDADTYAADVQELLLPEERIEAAYQSVRDGLVFTSLRIIVINIQGITGKKKDFTSLPYNRIQSFSVETSGIVDLDSEVTLWFSGLGKVKLEFTRNCNVGIICRMISAHTLR